MFLTTKQSRILSKLIEKLVAYQMMQYLEASCLLLKLQSSFRKGYETEKVLLQLLLDKWHLCFWNVIMLALLDVNAAFDMCNHEMLFKHPVTSFDISGWPLEWMCFFLDRWTVMVTHSSDCRLGNQACQSEYCKAQYCVEVVEGQSHRTRHVNWITCKMD